MTLLFNSLMLALIGRAEVPDCRFVFQRVVMSSPKALCCCVVPSWLIDRWMDFSENQCWLAPLTLSLYCWLQSQFPSWVTKPLGQKGELRQADWVFMWHPPPFLELSEEVVRNWGQISQTAAFLNFQPRRCQKGGLRNWGAAFLELSAPKMPKRVWFEKAVFLSLG